MAPFVALLIVSLSMYPEFNASGGNAWIYALMVASWIFCQYKIVQTYYRWANFFLSMIFTTLFLIILKYNEFSQFIVDATSIAMAFVVYPFVSLFIDMLTSPASTGQGGIRNDATGGNRLGKMIGKILVVFVVFIFVMNIFRMFLS